MILRKKKPPKAEICIVRCVLQHLSNAMIKKFLTNVENKFEFLIITEHVPSSNSFKSNQDITSGPGIRLHKNSGVDLAKYPFNLKYKKKRILNITKSDLIEGCLKTSLYQIK